MVPVCVHLVEVEVYSGVVVCVCVYRGRVLRFDVLLFSMFVCR